MVPFGVLGLGLGLDLFKIRFSFLFFFFLIIFCFHFGGVKFRKFFPDFLVFFFCFLL